MLKKQNIICISSIDWDFIWQGHQEIMSAFAKNGNKVIFIENTGVRTPGIRDFSRIKKRIRDWFKGIKGIRKESENLYIFSPLVLPFPYLRLARWINRRLILSVLERWMNVVNFDNPIVWTFLPTPISLEIADHVRRKLLVYYCIDNFAVSSPSAKKIKRSEERLIKKADLVFTTSQELHKHCSVHNDRVYDFPFAVNLKRFERARDEDLHRPKDLETIKSPIVGYVGGVHKWIDQDLIKEAAISHPNYSFVFLGPLQTNVSSLSKLKNVYFLGKKDHADLPGFIKYFDVSIIPYLITDYTKNVYPTKLNEYLALGKAVVSTPLPEVRAFNAIYRDVVYISEQGSGKFSDVIERALAEDNAALRGKRVEAARHNGWEARIEKMSDIVEEEVRLKELDKEAQWKEGLSSFYKIARKKALRFIVITLVLYTTFFRTPLIWFLAEPLKISDLPQRADVIAVFGGGVGETGSPGKSTIERSRYAVELYKEGYADKIIFSSGYSYKHNDAENMRLFAISMGVPEGAIILEKKANSTYENVIYAKEILNKYSYHSALIVSSPYNMRRAAMVFKRFGDGLKVLYVPVKDPQFYDKGKVVRLRQIRAILHEYLGIVYYWIKGYA